MAVVPRPFGAPTTRVQEGPTAAPLRRCTFRRVTTVEARGAQSQTYDVACMYPDRRRPIALGDLETARAICERCTYQGIFRADSD